MQETVKLGNGKIIKMMRRDLDMKNARLVLAVYECVEDSRAEGITVKDMWDNDYKHLYDDIDYSEKQLDDIIHVIDAAVDMVKDITFRSQDIEDQIKEMENKLSINVANRIIFMGTQDIKFNVMQGKNDKCYTVTYDRESSIKYLAFLKTLPNE